MNKLYIQENRNFEISQYKQVISDAELALKHKERQLIQTDSKDWKYKAIVSVGFNEMHDDTLADMTTLIDCEHDKYIKDNVFDSHKFLEYFIKTEKGWLERCKEKWAYREALHDKKNS